MRTLILMLFTVPVFGQGVKFSAGFIGNATPTTTIGYNIGASYEIPKTNDVVGYMVMENNYKAYYIPYYGTKLGKKTRLLTGINFVNDYSGPTKVLSQSFAVGFNYDFKKPWPDEIFNFYGGFMYTHNYFLLRLGFEIEPWMKKLKK